MKIKQEVLQSAGLSKEGQPVTIHGALHPAARHPANKVTVLGIQHQVMNHFDLLKIHKAYAKIIRIRVEDTYRRIVFGKG